MSNTLTGLVPTIYDALTVVSRELVGMIPAVTVDASAAGAAKDQTIRSPVAPAQTTANFTPAATTSSGSDRAMSYVDTTLSSFKKTSWHLTGEEEKSILQSNQDILKQSFAQAFRVHANEIEATLTAHYKEAAYAYGTAATTPFGTNLAEAAEIRKLLDDNGAPAGDRSLIVDTTAGAALRTLAQYTDVDRAGSKRSLRRGSLERLFGLDIGESAQIKTHTSGTDSSDTVNLTAGYAVGSTSIVLSTTSTSGYLEGDVVTFTTGGDGNSYVLASHAVGTNTIVLNDGLKKAVANAATVNHAADYTANMAFSRDAILLVTRPPVMPENANIEQELVTDPVCGLTFLVCRIQQYGQVSYEVHIAYGSQVVNPEHLMLLIG